MRPLRAHRITEGAIVTARDRLAEILRERGMTQAELARRMDPPVDRSWVNKRLLGHVSIEADDLPRLARALGVRVAALLEDPPAPSQARDEDLSYADIFVRSLARAWQGDEMTETERDFLESLSALLRGYREQARAEALRHLRGE